MGPLALTTDNGVALIEAECTVSGGYAKTSILVRDPQGMFASQAVLCTDQEADPVQILHWFVMRWPVEVTFHEVRTHLGVETQRQWSDLAILRTTPALLGVFSLVTIFAHQLLDERPFPVRQAAWYAKAHEMRNEMS